MCNTSSTPLDICYEDEYLLVVNKPSGVLSQPGKPTDGSILTQAKNAYPDATGSMLVHRLDMDTSGLLILTKSRSTHRHLQQQFEQRQVSKRYVAILSQAPAGWGGRIRLPLRLDIDNRPAQIICFEHGKSAETLWYRCHLSDEKIKEFSRVVFKPITGRTHQLRVHAAHPMGLNAPIVGDRLYGVESSRLMLHADQIGFTHPATEQRMQLHCPAPF